MTRLLHHHGPRAMIVLGAAVALALAACGGSPGDTAGGPEGGMPTADPEATFAIPDDILVQLTELPSARTIPYFSAELSGRYQVHNLSVIPMEGDPTVGDPTLALGEEEGPQVLIAPAAAALRASAEVVPLVQVAQIATRSGDRILVPASSGMKVPADLAGARITVLEGAPGESVLPALVAAGVDPASVTIESAPFDAAAVAAGELAAVHVRVEDEWAQVLEQTDAVTGALIDPAAFTVIDLSDPAVAMPGDGVWVRADWLPGHEDVVTRFLAAILAEWVACREDPEACAVNAYDNGSLLPLQHQRWTANEMNGLLWPADGGLGSLDATTWDTVAARAVAAGILSQLPTADVGMRADLLAAASDLLEGTDLRAADFSPASVEIMPGGEESAPVP